MGRIVWRPTLDVWTTLKICKGPLCALAESEKEVDCIYGSRWLDL